MRLKAGTHAVVVAAGLNLPQHARTPPHPSLAFHASLRRFPLLWQMAAEFTIATAPTIGRRRLGLDGAHSNSWGVDMSRCSAAARDPNTSEEACHKDLAERVASIDPGCRVCGVQLDRGRDRQ